MAEVFAHRMGVRMHEQHGLFSADSMRFIWAGHLRHSPCLGGVAQGCCWGEPRRSPKPKAIHKVTLQWAGHDEVVKLKAKICHLKAQPTAQV